ncbi:MAG: trypsin-like peptidase domain-containing protein [Clostridiales bacterium]|nr:trypsin-like peptidase domain-containing protein [Clostridiales bacterium]
MKKDDYNDEYREEPFAQDEDLWGSAPGAPEDRPRRHRARRRKRRPARWPNALLSVLVGVLIGVIVCRAGQYLVYRTMTGESGDAYGDDFDYDYGYNDVETNDEASQEYSLPLYTGDSSGLTVTLNAPAEQVLSAAELYEQELPATVSITVYAGSSAAYGSGMILTADGYLLTCAHVIEDSERAVITTSDGAEYEATLVGSDAQTDLAVLKIEAEGLTAVEFVDSEQLVIGETVYAIGDPLGPQFRSSLTDGLISGLNRQVSANGYAMTLIQTTAAVNSGNSGCPLFNSRGQVVGVVNMKMSSSSATASIDNMGLAVPSATVKEIVETLATEGSVSRAVLGVSCYAVSSVTSQVYGVPEGLWVATIDSASDCAAQGLQVDDIITRVDGVEVSSVTDFQAATADLEVGDTVTLTVWREPETETDEADGSASAQAEDDGYHYEYYGEITVALIDSNTLAD